MELGFEVLLSWQFLFFSLVIAAITFVTRKIVEYFLDKPEVPASKTAKLWTELLLPIGPVCTGGLVGYFFKQFQYPDNLTTATDRVFFGLIAGLLSGLIYRVIKGMLKSKLPGGQGSPDSDGPSQTLPSATTIISNVAKEVTDAMANKDKK
jgi:hypothetical protein